MNMKRILKTWIGKGCFVLIMLYGTVLAYLFLKGEGILIPRFTIYFFGQAIASGISIFTGFLTCCLITYPLDRHFLKSTKTFCEAVLGKYSYEESLLFYILFFGFLGTRVATFFSPTF